MRAFDLPAQELQLVGREGCAVPDETQRVREGDGGVVGVCGGEVCWWGGGRGGGRVFVHAVEGRVEEDVPTGGVLEDQVEGGVACSYYGYGAALELLAVPVG